MEEYRIHDLRLSLIWNENLPNLLKNNIPSGVNLSFLGDQVEYVSTFNQIQKREVQKKVIEGLQLPWPPHTGTNNFWSYYLETRIPGHIHKSTIWKKLVPFYHKIDDFNIDTPSWLQGRLVFQSYIYPHSFALIISIILNQSLSLTLEDAVAMAFHVRRTGRFQVTSSNHPTPKMLSLDEIAREGLQLLREYILGPNAPPHEWSVKPPFSVVTVIQGSGGSKNIVPGHKVLCFLDALARWPTYDWDDPPPQHIPGINLNDKIRVNEGYVGDLLHITPRGRVVWYPKHFLKKIGRINKLSCYHTNLNMLSMQIDSLGSLILNAAQEINIGNPPPPSSFYETCIKRAAINLSLLYLGGGSEKRTYRSWSAKRQIEQNNYLEAINIVRDQVCNLLPILATGQFRHR
jgi:hypothetical protein